MAATRPGSAGGHHREHVWMVGCSHCCSVAALCGMSCGSGGMAPLPLPRSLAPAAGWVLPRAGRRDALFGPLVHVRVLSRQPMRCLYVPGTIGGHPAAGDEAGGPAEVLKQLKSPPWSPGHWRCQSMAAVHAWIQRAGRGLSPTLQARAAGGPRVPGDWRRGVPTRAGVWWSRET